MLIGGLDNDTTHISTSVTTVITLLFFFLVCYRAHFVEIIIDPRICRYAKSKVLPTSWKQW